jgi:hypothetical protein
MTPLEPILSKIRENIHKRSPLRLRASVRSTELLLKQKCGKTPNTQWTRFCENIFLGKGFRKISANSFEMFWVWIPPAERGLGNECGRKLFGFLAGRALRKENTYIEILTEPKYNVSLCLPHPPVRTQFCSLVKKKKVYLFIK